MKTRRKHIPIRGVFNLLPLCRYVPGHVTGKKWRVSPFTIEETSEEWSKTYTMPINAKISFALLAVPDVMIRIFPNNHTGKYLSNLYGIVQLVIKRFGRFMVKDLTGTISALRCAAVGRCRERLEQAAQKAKGIIKNGQTPERREISLTYKEQYGVTSVMKRKHGL